MKRRTEGGEKIASVGLYNPEELAKFALKIKGEGFVPADVLREEFGNEVYTQAIAILFRQHRFLREVPRDWSGGTKVMGYEIADRRFSKTEIKNLPEGLGFMLELTQSTRPTYDDYKKVEVLCRWTSDVVASSPSKDSSGEVNIFQIDLTSAVYIPAYCARAMAMASLPLIGKPMAAGKKIRFRSIRISSPTIKERIDPIIKNDQGLGLRRSQSLPAGTEFVLSAWVPTSAIPVADYLQMLREGGSYVRLSPARSAGWGEFEVVKLLEG